MKTLRIPHAGRRFVATAALAALLLTGLSVFAPRARALDYFVGCGDSGALRVAIADAQTNGVDDRIVLGKGCTYTLTSPWLATANGLPLFDEAGTTTTVFGSGATLIRAKDAPNFRHLEVAGGAALVLRDLTLSGGKIAEFSNGPSQAGSVLVDPGGALTAERLTVKYSQILVADGSVTTAAGGILNDGGTVSLNLSTVKGNLVSAFSVTAFSAGGGIAGDGGGTTTLKQTTVKDNDVNAFGAQQGSALGGGIVTLDPADTLVLDRATVTGNAAGVVSGSTAAAVGGGMAVTGTTSVRESFLSENEATSESAANSESIGGGIFNSGHLEMDTGSDDDGSEVTLNRASCPDKACIATGGGYAGRGEPGNPASAIFASTVFKDNLARSDKGVALGGGLYVDEGTADLSESLVKRNKATAKLAKGGGVFATSTGAVTLDASKVKDNKPGSCYGVFGC